MWFMSAVLLSDRKTIPSEFSNSSAAALKPSALQSNWARAQSTPLKSSMAFNREIRSFSRIPAHGTRTNEFALTKKTNLCLQPQLSPNPTSEGLNPTMEDICGGDAGARSRAKELSPALQRWVDVSKGPEPRRDGTKAGP